MNIAFCTTCKGRTQHLELTLPANLRDNADYEHLKFIVLDYGSHDHLIHYLKTNHEDAIASGRLVVYSYPWNGRFRMAHAKNMAHRLGAIEGAQILVNIDADNFTGPGFATYLADQFAGAKSGMFMWSRMIKEGSGRLPRGISGRIAVTHDDFIKVGGYDQRFQAWSPDDKDFTARLERLQTEPKEVDSKYLSCITHNEKVRFREYPQAEANINEYDVKPPMPVTSVVNGGMIGTGNVFKNFSHTRTAVHPVPTRIFGIGMHKTATTSLHHALGILGLDSAHWKSAHWAKAIWNQMISYGFSPTLEQHYAVSDLPITLLYRELDAAYPGSKFILTTRNEYKWLESVRRHWLPEFNPYRGQWDNDPFTHMVHRALYGQRNFDPAVFLARFRQHNAEVMEYFKDRPHDLLVMDVEKEATWEHLCTFLGYPIPSVPYPMAFITAAQAA